MRVVAFDLSSTCIGVTIAEVEEREYKTVRTMPIIPVKPDGVTLGYTTKQPKKIASGGLEFKGFLKEDEMSISKNEAAKRAAHFKSMRHNYLLRNIGFQCGRILRKVQPEQVVIERNESFNGILTTKLLAEIAGGIYFYCGANAIELFDYNEATIRAYIRKNLTDFSYENHAGMQAIDTKWEIRCRLKTFFSNHLQFDRITLDETDSLAALYYHIEKGRYG